MKYASCLGAAGALLLAASAAHAADLSQATGYVDLDYSHMSIGASGLGNTGVDVWGGKAAVALPVAQNWGVQLDGAVNDFNVAGGDQAVVTPTAHAFYHANDWLAGGFVGAEFAPHVHLVGGGLEGQMAPNRAVVLNGSVGYAGLNRAGIDLWGVRAGGQGFVTDNFALDASVNYTGLNGGGVDANMWSETVGGEYKVDRTPLSVTLSYERDDLNRVNLHSDSVLVGVRWAFGGGTLRDRAAHGASLPSLTQTFGGEAGQGLIAAVSSAAGYIF